MKECRNVFILLKILFMFLYIIIARLLHEIKRVKNIIAIHNIIFLFTFIMCEKKKILIFTLCQVTENIMCLRYF